MAVIAVLDGTGSARRPRVVDSVAGRAVSADRTIGADIAVFKARVALVGCVGDAQGVFIAVFQVESDIALGAHRHVEFVLEAVLAVRDFAAAASPRGILWDGVIGARVTNLLAPGVWGVAAGEA